MQIMVNKPPPKETYMADDRCHIVSSLVRQGAGGRIYLYDAYHTEEEEDHPDDLVSLEYVTYALVVHFFIVLSLIFLAKS